jgi:hypothetical protein
LIGEIGWARVQAFRAPNELDIFYSVRIGFMIWARKHSTSVLKIEKAILSSKTLLLLLGLRDIAALLAHV